MNVSMWSNALPRDVVEDLCRLKGVDPALGLPGVADFLVSSRGLSIPSVYRYISYLKLMAETSHAIAEVYDLRSGAIMKGQKEHLRQVDIDDVLYMANHLYLLSSFGVEGALLECGCSHGYSTCCLSHACARLGRRLYSADSFEGLPQPPDDESYFRKGDFAASLEETSANVGALGRPEAVTFLRGWFSNSLKGWNEPLCMIWLDVDLYESARDVIENTLSSLDHRGVIYSHEFTDREGRVHDRSTKIAPNAVFDCLEQRGLICRSTPLRKYLGVIGFEGSSSFDTIHLVPELLSRIHRLDDRWRQYDEIRTSRTVRTAFKLKKWLWP